MSNYIYGMHEQGAEYIFREEGVTGWLVFTEELGHDPTHHGGRPYGYLAGDLTPIVRLNNGYGAQGTIPAPQFYEDFAKRVANWVNLSFGCTRWIIGNEPNHPVEWPAGVPIQAESYALCYVLCRNAIRSLFAHKDDAVLPAGIAPWCAEIEGWLEYFTRMLDSIEERGSAFDGIVLHTYTHGASPSLITNEDTMDPPFEGLHFNFRTYRDFLNILPVGDGTLPVYITETDQNVAWADVNSGWVQAAYKEINEWNQERTPKIHCLCLYRWPPYDQYVIEGKQGVINDLRAAMRQRYIWKEDDMSQENWKIVYQNSLDAFYDQDGIPEVTIPVGHKVVWDTTLARPEMDAKDAQLNHPEVHTPRYSAVGFLPFKTFKWWCYTDMIAIDPLAATIASAWVMIVAHGTSTDVTVPGECGMRVGFGNTTDPNSAAITWSDWFVVRGSLANERQWVKLSTPQFVPNSGLGRLFIQCNNDLASNIAAGHWDDEQVMQYSTGGGGVEPPPLPPPPPPSDDVIAEINAIASGLDGLSLRLRMLVNKIGGNAMAKALVSEAKSKLEQAEGLL